MKKFIIWFCAISLVLLVGGGLAYRHAAKRDFFFQEIEQFVQHKTGYTVNKTAPLQLSLLPRPKLTGFDLIIRNPKSESAPTLTKVERLSFELKWLSLLADKPVLDVELDSADIDLQIDGSGNANWMTEEIQTITGELPLDLGKVDAEKTRLKYTNHLTNEILGLDLEHFDVDLSAGKSRARIDSAGRFGGSRFLAVGDVIYSSDDRQLQLSLAVGAGEAGDVKVGDIEVTSVTAWIEQNAARFPLHGLVEGAVSIEDKVPYGILEFRANIKSVGELTYLVEELSYIAPDIGPAAASGALQLNGSDFDIEHFEAALHHDHLSVEAEGSIHNLLSDVQFDLDAQIETRNLKAVAVPGRAKGIASDLINRLDSVDISAAVKKKVDGISISELDLGLAYDSLSAKAVGNVDIVKDDVRFDLEFLSEASDAADLFALLDVDHPGLSDLGALDLSAKASGQRHRYTLESASGQLQDGNIRTTLRGDINTEDEALNFVLDTTVDIDNLSRLASLLPEQFAPYLRELSGGAAADISGSVDEFSLSNLEINLAREDRELHISGNLSDLPDEPESKLDFHFTTTSAMELEQYFSGLTDMQIAGPLDLGGTIQSKENKIYIRDIQFQAERTDLEGGILIDQNYSPPYVFIVLDSRELYTKLVVRDPDPDTDSNSPTAPVQPSEEPQSEISDKELEKMFKTYTEGVEINTDWIKDLNLYFSFRADKARLGGYNLDELLLTIDAREGVFTLAEYEVVLEGRPISFAGSINTNFDPPLYQFWGEVEGDTLEALLKVEDELFVGGELSGKFQLESEGVTLGQVIKNLDGKALVTMGPLTIRSNALNIVSSDMLLGMLRGLTRNPKDQPSSNYDCGVLGVEMERGVARIRRSFTLQAKDYNMAGNGRLDLNTGFIDLKVYPKARKGLGLSVSTVVGGFKMKGHLAAPNFGLGGGGLVTAMLTGYALTPTAAAAATNPASATILVTGLFAKGIFDRLTASNYTCKNTLRRIERRQSRQTQPRDHHPGKMSF